MVKVRAAYVTDHAVLRYIERVLKVDVEAAREQVARNVAIAEPHDGATAVTKDGFRYVLQGKTVVTVKPQHAPDPRTACCDRRQLRDD